MFETATFTLFLNFSHPKSRLPYYFWIYPFLTGSYSTAAPISTIESWHQPTRITSEMKKKITCRSFLPFPTWINERNAFQPVNFEEKKKLRGSYWAPSLRVWDGRGCVSRIPAFDLNQGKVKQVLGEVEKVGNIFSWILNFLSVLHIELGRRVERRKTGLDRSERWIPQKHNVHEYELAWV